MRRAIGKIQKIADAVATLYRTGRSVQTDAEIAEQAKLPVADVTEVLDQGPQQIWGKLPFGLLLTRTPARHDLAAGVVVSTRGGKS